MTRPLHSASVAAVLGNVAVPEATHSAAMQPIRSGERTRLRVCLITTEFHGLFKNGGIGTANTGLAYALSLAGFDVTVAFADADEKGPRVKEGDFAQLQRTYGESGITLDFVPASPLVPKAFDDPRSASYSVYLYLKQGRFDVVYFNDCGGQGFYALLAKKTGVFRDAPRMYVVAHGPQEWVLELNSLRYWDRVPVITAFLERRSAALADALISPSQYLVDWMVSRDWVMPANVLVTQNIVRLHDLAGSTGVRTSVAPIQEIVFFGRLEVRKGVELFCDAIELLAQSVDLSGIRITFLGKFSHIGGLHSGMYVVERARRWRSSLRILSTYGQEEALAYLDYPGKLAVIPSHAENSPCVVAECLQMGLPFVATDSGGTRELVAGEDRELCLVAPRREDLAEKLGLVLREGQRPARLAISQADCLSQWLSVTDPEADTHSGEGVPGAPSLASSVQAPKVRGAKRQHDTTADHGRLNGAAAVNGTAASAGARVPVVSVCLTASSLTLASEAFLASLLRQDYPAIEFILLQDEKPLAGEAESARRAAALAAIESAGQQNGFRVVPVPAGDRGVQRNAAAALATGDYLLFVEEDSVVLVPGCIGTLVRAALLTGAEVLTALPMTGTGVPGRPIDAAKGSLSHFPVGGCAELGALENCFGYGVLLVARRSFEEHGGFTSPCDAEIVDWLFLATAVLAGLYLETVPEPLFSHRMRSARELDSSRAVDNHRRVLAAFGKQRLAMFEHTIESVAHSHRDPGERQWGVLAGVGGEALEIARRISSTFDSNSDEALRGFVQFCMERRKVDEALDFALHNGRSLLLDAIGSGKRVDGAEALDTVRRNTLEFRHEISLTDEVRERIKPVSAFPARDFAQPAGGVASFALDTGVTILKAAAVCPTGTVTMHAVARVEVSGQTPVSLALVVARPNARLRLSEQGLESSGDFWWSDWVPATPGKRLDVQVTALEPFAGLHDLHFLAKVGDDGVRPSGRVAWESVASTIVVNGALTASEIEPGEVATPVPREIIEAGVLLTRNIEFPFPIFVPGEKTLLHPLPGRIVLARLEGAVPAGARGVRAVVSVDLEKAHQVQFAVWLRASSRPVSSEAEFTAADAFSGWFAVRDTLRSHSFTVNLSAPATEPMDIYLATRVVGFSDVHFCHAVWREFLVLE